jgi:rhodanese-related sulfurtransferase
MSASTVSAPCCAGPWRALARDLVVLVVLSVAMAAVRQHWGPRSISWTGRWPTAATAAEDAYKMMAKPGDPAFVGLSEAIDLHDKKTATFLDARSAADFAAGRIPGARNLPFYQLDEFWTPALAGLNETSPLVIYCEGVGCELSFFLGRELQSAHYKNVRIFYGGYPEWSGAGLPIEK